MALATPPGTRKQFDDLLAQRILILDGAMGTMVHALKFDEAAISAASSSPTTRAI